MNLFAGVSPSESELKCGAWLGEQPSTSGIDNFEKLQQRKLDTVMMYIDWATDFDRIKSPNIEPIYNNGSIAIITWEAWGYSNTDISSGSKDDYIIQMANSMKSYGKEIWINLFHEANGNWYDWAIGDSDVNTNDTYKEAYKHVVDLFRAQGATNVKWVYTINCDSVGKNASFLGHYPGDDYVDYISIDGYNWGTTQSWGSTWKSFDATYKNAYNKLSSIEKPMLITEVSSTEIGGDKSDWITETFKTIKSSYPRIKLVSWFNEDKETDWRINSSTDSLNAYVKAINDTETEIIADSESPATTSSPTDSESPAITSSPTDNESPAITSSPTDNESPTITSSPINNEGTVTTSSTEDSENHDTTLSPTN
jgi:endoglucanase